MGILTGSIRLDKEYNYTARNKNNQSIPSSEYYRKFSAEIWNRTKSDLFEINDFLIGQAPVNNMLLLSGGMDVDGTCYFYGPNEHYGTAKFYQPVAISSGLTMGGTLLMGSNSSLSMNGNNIDMNGGNITLVGGKIDNHSITQFVKTDINGHASITGNFSAGGTLSVASHATVSGQLALPAEIGASSTTTTTSHTVNFNNGNNHVARLGTPLVGGGVGTITFNMALQNPQDGAEYKLLVINGHGDVNGTVNLTWPTDVVWANADIPASILYAEKQILVTLTYFANPGSRGGHDGNGSATYYGTYRKGFANAS